MIGVNTQNTSYGKASVRKNIGHTTQKLVVIYVIKHRCFQSASFLWVHKPQIWEGKGHSRVSFLNSFLLSFLARRDSTKSFLRFGTKQNKFLIKKFLIKKKRVCNHLITWIFDDDMKLVAPKSHLNMYLYRGYPKFRGHSPGNA